MMASKTNATKDSLDMSVEVFGDALRRERMAVLDAMLGYSYLGLFFGVCVMSR